MNLAEFSITRKTSTYVLSALVFLGGLSAFQSLGRLEDPEFTIKEAVVTTLYPGASPLEVSEEVTEVIEEAVQSMGQLKEVRSLSKPGLSIIYAEMQDKYDASTLPQVWDELRRKVGDIQASLPPGAGPSMVNDDFGDVYGVFLTIYGDGYSAAELMDVGKMLKRELLLVQDVAKVAFWGVQQEAVFVEISRARMSQLGISPQQVYQTLGLQNTVSNAGRVHVGSEYIRFNPTGMFESVQEIGDLLIRGDSDSLVYLRDVAEISRGYQEPPTEILYYNGQPALGMGVSVAAGGNVVVMGQGIEARLKELQSQVPAGIELGVISYQSRDVTAAISAFTINLLEAVAIVLVVLWIFMGWRSAFLIGGILLLTIVATFVFMGFYEVTLQRISLGALIIALGMLVDNAIVVVEGIVIGAQTGKTRLQAALETVQATSTPLLGATFVAILAFAAIGVSQDSTGEYCRSLFQVILFSLGLSWVFAVTVTPLVGISFLKAGEQAEGADPYAAAPYRIYRGFLEACLRRRGLTILALLAYFALSLYGFGYVDQSFFPDSTRNQFYVDYWLPEGTHIRDTERDVTEIDEWIRDLEGVTETASLVGRGALRFLLTYTAEDVNSAFGHIIISVEDYRLIDALGEKIREHIREKYPDSQAWYKKFIVGPGGGAKIEAQFRGPDGAVLRQLSEQVQAIMREEPAAVNIRDDWRQRVKLIEPVYLETPARVAGVTRPDLTDSLQTAFDGRTVGQYREEDDLLPIIARAPAAERESVDAVNSLQIWSSGANRAVPFAQVVSNLTTGAEDQLIRRINRMPTIRAQCDQGFGTAEALRRRMAKQIEAVELPPGYEFEWEGEFGNSQDAQAALFSKIPFTIVMMILVVIMLFDRIKQPIIIYLTLPLALIGVTVGLLSMGQPFGFMALLGFLSLSGMLIKNAIVLIDQTDIYIREGIARYEAVVLAGVSRSRPVAMAALTTMLGMIPLFQDAFFKAMAVTIVFGLGFATVLTLIVVPTLYAIFFRIPAPAR